MRSIYSVKNSITSLISNLVATVLGFIAQACFIRVLGAEYLGLNGLFTNVLTVLSFFELGIGNAIVFHLYKPISNNNVEKMKSLMNFYKKAYNIIALVVLVCGLMIIPFLNIIVGKITIDINIVLIYIMFLISTVSSYLLMYKRNLIYANQKSYIINIVHIAYLVILNFFQLLFLYLTKNYYIYLGIKIVCQILENIVNSVIANKLYPFIKEKNIAQLDKDTRTDIFNKVKALIFHKVGTVVVTGTDNILISSFFGVKLVGLYSNYSIIINAVNTLFGQIITSTTASVGDLLTTKDTNKKYNVFSKVRFINFILASIGSIGIFVSSESFISLWVGKEYILNNFIVIVLILNCFQNIMKCTYNTFKDSGGIWIEDRHIPIIESIVNLICSLVFLHVFGLAGVFIGTLISSLILWLYSYPKYVYNKLFKRSYIQYLKETLSYLIIFVFSAFITYVIAKRIYINNIYLEFIKCLILSLIIPSIIYIIIFRKTNDFKYFIQLIKTIFINLKPKFQRKLNTQKE